METTDQGWHGLHVAGGIGIIVAGLLVLVTLPLIPMLIPSLAPATVQSGLQSIQSQRFLYGTTWGLYLVSDLLYLIPFPALYVALRQRGRGATLIAVLLNTMFVAIDVGVDIPLRFSLIGLSTSYTSAVGIPEQAAYVAVAQLTMDLANLSALVATFLQFSAIILVSYAMLRDNRFRRGSAAIGITGAILGLLFIPTFLLGSQLSGLFNIAGFVLLVVWSVMVGLSLYRMR
jgi:hypothetical protein